MSDFKYPSIAEMASPNHAEKQEASSPAGPTISTGAIAGIAVGGAVILFAAVATLLIKLAKRQVRRRASISPSEFPEIAAESGAGPRRLRKRSIIGEQAATAMNKVDDGTGMEESRSRRSSLQVSPTKTRRGSFSIGNGSGTGTGSALNSVDTQMGIQVQKTRSPDKQRGYDVYGHRRKSSWIDEDRLHGPTITSPQKTKQKHRRRVSWFDGGLARSLSRLSTRSGIGEVSPTLPYTEGGKRHELETPAESPGAREGSKSVHFNGYKTPRSSQQQQQQQQTNTSPQRMYGPNSIISPNSSSSNPAQSPPDIIHNPRYRSRVSFQAAQQLAGGARLPAPVNIPQGQGQTKRQPILKHSATDTELSEILRMTAERLQDGNRSERRQTLMTPYAPRRLTNGGFQIRTDITYTPSDRGEISPAKSNKSAPATMSYAELEGSTPKIQSPQKQMQTPRHSRQKSHVSRISQGSILSEPDSLVAPKRESLSGVQTALSSPSRHARSTEPTPSPQSAGQQGRPFSYGSSMSSALSTLYSMEESSVRSPPANDLRFDGSPMNNQRRTPEKVLSAFNMLNANRQPEADGQISPKHRFDDDDIPPPLRIRRGTLGGTMPPNNTPSSRPASHQRTRSKSPLKRISSFAVHAMNGNDDPFTSVPTPKNPARLSKVFSPLPADVASGKADRKKEKEKESTYENTPTPSPTRRTAMPSPRSILNSPSYKRAPSPAISEAGLSSVYDSYNYTLESQRDTSGSSTATIIPPPKIGSEISPAKVATSIPATERDSRISFRVPNYAQNNGEPITSKQARRETTIMQPLAPGSPLRPRRSMPSAESMSIYSQDQDEDSVAPLRASVVLRGSSKSVRMSHTISELRRMNSQISTMSDQSVASTTLPVMRGGGSSPGKQGGGGRNYLALGGNLRNSVRYGQTGANGAGHRRSGSMGRARRSTVVLQGLDMKTGGIGTSTIKHNGQLVTRADKLKRQETSVKRASVESLYDEAGFLKG